MSSPSPAARAALRSDFDLACSHFHMTAEARDIAWRAAERHFGQASACYRAIANSLRVIDPGARRSKSARVRRSSRSAP